MKSANKIAFFNILSTFILHGLTFLTAPIISRLLGPSNFGLTIMYVTWVSIITSVFGLQTQSSIAVSKRDYVTEEQQNKYQSSIITLSAFVYTFFSIIVVLSLNYISKLIDIQETIILMMLIQGFGQYCVLFANTKFTYEFKANYNFILTMILSLTSVSFSVFLINMLDNNYSYWGRILGILIPYVIIGYGIFLYIVAKGRHYIDIGIWRYCLSLSLPIVIHSLTALLLNQSDRLMIKEFLDVKFVGVYSLACTFSTALITIWNAFNNSWVPFYYEYSRKNQLNEVIKHAINYLELFSVISVSFIMLGPEVYTVFASKEYWDGKFLISIFAIGNFFVFLYSFPANFEFYNKKTRLIATGTLLAALCNIILNYILIKPFGMFGAAIGTCVAHIMQFLFHHFAASYYIDCENKYPFTISFLYPYLCFFIGMCVVSYTIMNYAVLRWCIGLSMVFFEVTKIIIRKSIF